MPLPTYLTPLRLSELAIDYEWKIPLSHNTLWAVTDETDQVLADALTAIASRARFALGVACAEWVVARMVGHVDVSDAILRIDAAWVDPTRPLGDLPPTQEPKQLNGPVRSAMKILGHGCERIAGSETTHWMAMGLSLLADQIVGRHPAFRPWFGEALRRATERFPASACDDPIVPREFFEPVSAPAPPHS